MGQRNDPQLPGVEMAMNWTPEEYEKYKQGEFEKKKAKSKHKYGATPVREGGRFFASKSEKYRWDELELLERAGAISNLKFQPVYLLTKSKIKYRADFSYLQDGEQITEDIKGVWTSRFRMIAKLWEYYGPYKLRVTQRKGKRTEIKKEIMPLALDK